LNVENEESIFFSKMRKQKQVEDLTEEAGKLTRGRFGICGKRLLQF